jgi:hypothetical protein
MRAAACLRPCAVDCGPRLATGGGGSGRRRGADLIGQAQGEVARELGWLPEGWRLPGR